jgi:hypothetical protein
LRQQIREVDAAVNTLKTVVSRWTEHSLEANRQHIERAVYLLTVDGGNIQRYQEYLKKLGDPSLEKFINQAAIASARKLMEQDNAGPKQ